MEAELNNPTLEARTAVATNGSAAIPTLDNVPLGPTLGERLKWHWGKLVLLALGTSLVAGAITWASPLKYTSSVLLFVHTREGEGPTDFSAPATADLKELLFTATSTEVIDHLIDTFDLRAHYGIPAADPLAHARTYTRALDAIQPQYLDAQCLVVHVHDRDRDLAMHMANTIHRTLERIVQRRAVTAMKSEAALAANVLLRTGSRTAARTAMLRRMLAEDLAGQHRTRSLQDEERLERSLALLAAVQLPVAEMERATDESAERLAQAAQPAITLIRAALPDVSITRAGTTVRVALICFLLSLLIGVSVLLLVHFHLGEVRALLRSRSPR